MYQPNNKIIYIAIKFTTKTLKQFTILVIENRKLLISYETIYNNVVLLF